ncbi:ROK family protein [Marinilactibacillus sp. Marseille-P9653]|uniref:ROK family protein n=1 Tax=Marinilactibacillus sp. Marseille-P9653 TaxID=2866583 RepID=UPI001CE3CA07|nr:ROK family protein [Marinilactibacillus sp. Marseille-P9653]
MKNYLIYDVGGSSIKYAVMNEEEILTTGKMKTPTKNMEDFIDTIVEIYSEFKSDVSGVAFSMPGIIDSDRGYAVHGGSLEFIHQINLKEMFEEKIDQTLVIENDGKSAALGEVWKGKLQGIKDGIALIIGTGIGGGIIANGQLIKGHHLAAGEFSTIRTDGQLPLSKEKIFANKGSAVKLVKRAAKALGEDPEHYSGVEFFKEIKAGNQKAEQLFSQYCQTIAAQIMNFQTMFDPEVIVIGGGMSEEPLFVEGIQRAVDHLFAEDFMTEINGFQAKVVQSELGNEANLYGALYQYLLKTNQKKI